MARGERGEGEWRGSEVNDFILKNVQTAPQQPPRDSKPKNMAFVHIYGFIIDLFLLINRKIQSHKMV